MYCLNNKIEELKISNIKWIKDPKRGNKKIIKWIKDPKRRKRKVQKRSD
jgi:hypothetical protein